MNENHSSQVRSAIDSGNINEAERLIRETPVDSHCQEAEYVVGTILRGGYGDTPLGLLTLQMFLGMYNHPERPTGFSADPNVSEAQEKHRLWVHALSHFTKKLWERRLLSWIKQLYILAFKGAIELGDGTYCERLLGDYAELGLWCDDPAEFGMTVEDMEWFAPKNVLDRYSLSRIQMGAFLSEREYIAWRLSQEYTHYGWDVRQQKTLVEIEKVTSLVARYTELGGDPKSCDGLIPRLLREHLVRLETAISTDVYQYPLQHFRIAESLERTRVQLQEYDGK